MDLSGQDIQIQDGESIASDIKSIGTSELSRDLREYQGIQEEDNMD